MLRQGLHAIRRATISSWHPHILMNIIICIQYVYIYIYNYMYVYIYIYIYLCVCVLAKSHVLEYVVNMFGSKKIWTAKSWKQRSWGIPPSLCIFHGTITRDNIFYTHWVCVAPYTPAQCCLVKSPRDFGHYAGTWPEIFVYKLVMTC